MLNLQEIYFSTYKMKSGFWLDYYKEIFISMETFGGTL